MCRQLSILTCVIASCVTTGLHAGSVPAIPQNSSFRLPNGMKITSVTPSAKSRLSAPDIRIAAETPSLPQPPMAAFRRWWPSSPPTGTARTILTGSKSLVSSYVGKPLNAPAEKNFVIGVLDTGSVADLAAGDSAELLGLKGSYLTTNTLPIGGVSGTMDATITHAHRRFCGRPGGHQGRRSTRPVASWSGTRTSRP